jgi:alkylhydroperoxidase family enzyme
MTEFPGELRRVSPPRIAPGTRSEIGPVNALIAGVIGRATGTGPPNVFTTLARNRRIFRAWLRFAGRLMPRGKLPRRDTELVILRVSVACGNDYEWGHHVRLGKRAGLTEAEIARVGEGPEAAGWSSRDQTILRAVDELVDDRVVSDATWAQLRTMYSERDLIELCLLAGHYVMLAGALNSLGVQPER